MTTSVADELADIASRIAALAKGGRIGAWAKEDLLTALSRVQSASRKADSWRWAAGDDVVPADLRTTPKRADYDRELPFALRLTDL